MNKVLIIRDDKRSTLPYQKILSSHTYQIAETHRGEDWLGEVIQKKPHLILIDNLFSNKEGLFIAKTIKEKVKNHFIYVMMIDSQTANGHESKYYEYLNDYVKKPVDEQVLKARVEMGLKIAKSFDEIKLLYRQSYDEIKELLSQKEKLIQNLNHAKENLEQKVLERTNELNQQNEILIRQSNLILHDMELAGKLQRNLLPQHSPHQKKYNIFSRYIPMDNIGGDFYDFITMRESKIAILLGDVSGHGITAAFITSMIKTIISNNRKYLSNPKNFFQYLNENLLGNIYHYFVTAFYGILDLENPSILFTSAGHPPPFLYIKRTGEIIDLETDGTVLGAIDNIDFENKETSLESGDRIFIFTDGLFEVFDEDRNIFGMDRLKELFKESIPLKGEQIIDFILQKVRSFSPDNQVKDDIAIVVIEVC
ncbi:MAG: hypothetical protein IEMM0008_0425 [bacterium]|nr:MAG: hypothetical protein IEMM0008_0425 [bacterium]